VKDERLYLHHTLARCERVAGYMADGQEAIRFSPPNNNKTW
jgi:hypothetical protein